MIFLSIGLIFCHSIYSIMRASYTARITPPAIAKAPIRGPDVTIAAAPGLVVVVPPVREVAAATFEL